MLHVPMCCGHPTPAWRGATTWGGRLGAGDILLFLTGQAEVDRAVAKVSDAVACMPAGSCGDLVALPLYAALPPELQVRGRPGRRVPSACQKQTI